ncbi:TetR/AcrR family transcriptional regulator [Actinomycetospora soli]|uniref:TetR/AcrR family transcriptional regulator n=1 Tax=Actinomycetospora soli TaxID=2893887 RepID=UPI001E544495|nr:TetR/AcrR family transcriptional regulator [Actinomycetospora soli]MCD2190398.1 TetR/AcrR family transcriptional regulator [Actinomycetospora soli]
MGRPRTFDEDAAVDAAVDLFWTKGYRATTPAELGAAMGLGKGSVYHAFGSKHELYRRALARYVEGQRAQFLEMLAGPGPADQRLRRALGLVLDVGSDARGCLVTTTAVESSPDDEVVAEFVRGVLAGQREALRAVIEDGRRTGDLPRVDGSLDAGVAADAVLALLNGARVLQRIGAPPTSLVDAAMRLI